VNPVFADSFYFIALFNERDRAHVRATELERTMRRPLVTTAWILTELADACAGTSNRTMVAEFIDDAIKFPTFIIIPFSGELFRRGLGLYLRRPDKEWSLTDCISFVVMEAEEIGDALTGDKHFEQAGFNALLK
jgi:predicted nucleic acid-binding protein